MQFDFPVIDPQVTTGTDLAEYLNNWVPAVESQHAGPARPPYLQPGGIWVEQVDADTWNVKLYTGAGDVQIGSVNPVTGEFSFLVGGKPPATVDDAIAYAIALG